MFTRKNFINYQKVPVSGESPVVSMVEDLEFIHLRTEPKMSYMFDFIEHRITLEDNIA